jgi:transcription elongation factor GreA
MERVPFTRDGYEKLQKELEKLKTVERPDAIRAIAEARSHGDLRENAEYHAARERQAFLEARINEWEAQLSRAEVIDYSGQKRSDVSFGAWVTLIDEETEEIKRYRIVGELEADITKGFLSLRSPIAQALMGKEVDDVLTIYAPKGEKEYVIKEVSY